MKRHDTVSDPTLSVFYQQIHARAGDLASTGFGEIADWLPAQVRRGLLGGGLPAAAPATHKAYDASADANLKLTATRAQRNPGRGTTCARTAICWTA